jgi:arylsulfatase A-like enzyme
VDESVGELVQELRTSGLYQNSVLVYSSDNGSQPFLWRLQLAHAWREGYLLGRGSASSEKGADPCF